MCGKKAFFLLFSDSFLKLYLTPLKNMRNIDILLALLAKRSFSKEYFGGIAQLGERLHGMQEVSGSIPLISTKF